MSSTASRADVAPGLTRFAQGTDPAVMLYPPGVYRAETDSELLADVMRRGDFARDRDVLDVGTGGGALAVAAARAGARSVTAVDLSLRSVATTWLNSRLARTRVRVRRGDLFTPVAGRRFGLVLSNPPYVPAATGKCGFGLPCETIGSGKHRRRCECVHGPMSVSWNGGLHEVSSAHATRPPPFARSNPSQ